MADLAVADIIKNITDDVKLLVQDQVELAKAELTPAAKKGGTGARPVRGGRLLRALRDHSALFRCRLRPG